VVRRSVCRRPQGRRVLHVQSISEWAPSCIGPYSQATRHAGLVHFAGQVGRLGAPAACHALAQRAAGLTCAF
jgi:enamine deaminase RidA (YjgF/YER057c/UK114 family)